MRSFNFMKDLHIATGFHNDCDELIRKCCQVKKLSYEKFCDIWKEMDFACVFYGTHSGAEIAEFSEEALHIAKSFMFSNKCDFEETVAGIYLVYAMLNLQPFVGFAPLKLIDEDVRFVEQLKEMARSQRRYDVLYILGSILIKGPCQFHVAQRERGMELTIRKYLEDDYRGDMNRSSRGVFSRNREELNLLEELDSLSLQYTKSKQDVTGTRTLNRNLNYMNEKVPSILKTSLKNVMFGFNKTSENVEALQSPKEKSKAAKSSLKERAMTNSITPMRHLTGINERRTIGKTSPQKPKAQTPTPTESPSPKKKTGQRKRKASSSLSKIVMESSEENDTDISLHDSDDSDKSVNRNDSDKSVNRNDSDKSVNRNDSDNCNETDKANDEKTLRINVDHMPVVITAVNEKEYEIEIIDQYDTDRRAKTIHIGAKKAKKATGEGKSAQNKTVLCKSAKRKEKRYLKKNNATSTFRRLGLADMMEVEDEDK